jgi:pimeloyl-ACP methyl ester carboxylesterase
MKSIVMPPAFEADTMKPGNTSSATATKPANAPVPFIVKALRILFNITGRIAPGPAGRLAYKLWIRPPRYSMPQNEQQSLASARQSEIHHAQHRVVRYEWTPEANRPETKTVLLVHGWSGRGTQLAPFVRPLLDRGYRVVSFDAPAHGQSSGKQTNLYEIADTLLKLEKLDQGYDAIITHSFGGPCVAAAMKRGMKTDCIVNIAPPASVSGLVEKFCSILRIPENAVSSLFCAIEQQFGKAVWQEAAMETTVAAFTTPALVIHDVDDHDVPWQEGMAIAQAWKHARFILTRGLGHRRILKDENTIRETVSFIDQQLTTAGHAADTQETVTVIA